MRIHEVLDACVEYVAYDGIIGEFQIYTFKNRVERSNLANLLTKTMVEVVH